MLQIEIEADFHLIGIGCHYKDYRFVWQVNNSLGINFVKKEDFCPHNREALFSNFEFEVDFEKAHIFSNKSQQGYLVKKKRQVDFWLLVKHSFDDEILSSWMKKINEFPDVLAVYDEKDEKTKEIFIF